MSIIIAIKEKEDFRYITVESDRIKQFDWVLNTLRNFYKSEEKVRALINLGNLEWLGPSPYKKNKGDDDFINCESKIRDNKLSPGKHGTSFASSEADLLKRFDRKHYTYNSETDNPRINCLFLFEDNKWFVLAGAHKEEIKTVDKSILKKEQLMIGLEVYRYNPSSNYNKLESVTTRSWGEVQQFANEFNRPYYIFRNNKLISVINPNKAALPEAV